MTIDNLDDTGAVNYSDALCADGLLKIARSLNAPSVCSGLLDVGDAGLGVPKRRGRVVVWAANGTVLVTGSLAKQPEAGYGGIGLKGPVDRYAVKSVSCAWVLHEPTGTLR